MTSVDSGVETGNDSNDSGQAEIQGFNGFGRGKAMTTITNLETMNKNQQQTSDNSNDQTSASCFNKTSNPMPYLEAGTSVPSVLHSFNPQRDFKVLLRCEGFRDKYDNDLTLKIERFDLKNKMKRFDNGKLMDRMVMKRRIGIEPFYSSHWNRKMRLAAATNNIELMTHILQERGLSPNDSDEQGRSPLHLACSRGYSEMVKLLLDHGANPNQIDSLGNTPLHLAAITSKISVVTLLLKAGTNVLSSDRRGYNPLQLAQAKLRMLQNCKGTDTNRIKEEIHKVVSMLMAYLEKQNDVSEQIEALSSFCSKLTLSNTNDQVQGDVKNLLASIDSLSLTS